MYTILIADDEELERRSLKMMIHNSIPEVETIVEARNGIELIKKCETSQFDVLIVDISMPGINGLEAMGILREKGYTSKTIIYTAHGEFEYAREALQYHADEYLLKPAKREKIIATVRQCLEKVKEERSLKAQNEYLKGLMKEMTPMIEIEFLTEVIEDSPSISKLQMYTQAMGISHLGGSILTFMMHSKKQEGKGKGRTKKEVAKRISIELKELVDALSYFADNERLICYVPISDVYTGYRFKIWIIEVIEIILQKIQHTHYLEIQVGIGMPYQTLDKIHDSYEESLKALYQIKDRHQIRCYSPDLKEQEINLFELYQEDLVKAIQEDHLQRCQLLITRITREYRHHELREVKEWALEGVMTLIDKLEEDTGKAIKDKLSINKLCEENRQVETVEELGEWLINGIQALSESLQYGEKHDGNEMVTVVKEYIKNHYKEELSLELLAEKVEITPYYLSKVFKQETGEKFVDYVNRVRIEKAKTFLNQYDYSVTELSLKVGYNSTTYFCKMFKKITGKTVGEFKHK